MSRFDGILGKKETNVIASTSISLQTKYLFPINKPLENQVIQAVATCLPDGTRETEWKSVSIENSYGYQYVFNNINDTALVQNVWVSITGNRQVGPLQNFTAGVGGVGLVYQGNSPAIFKVSATMSWFTTSNPFVGRCQLGILKNGAPQIGRIEGLLDSSGLIYPRNASTESMFELVNGDVVDVGVMNTADNEPIRGTYWSMSITQV